MKRDELKKWRCKECDEIILEIDFLIDINPFNKKATVIGCPLCKAIGGFTEICDDRLCTLPATCGFPSIGGYRRTCGKHCER